MKVKRFLKDTGGNVAMMFGICTTVLLSGAALAVDGTRLLSQRSNLQDIVDAAVLAGAIAAESDVDNREAIVFEAINFHLASIGLTVNLADININFDDTTETVTVGLQTEQDLILAGVIGQSMSTVSAESTASYALNNIQPVSMSFVLDVSGSMGTVTTSGLTRLQTLQQSMNLLFTEINDSAARSSNIQNFVRTGMNVYNTDVLPNFSVPMSQGWGSVLLETASLQADGGTNSTAAFEASYDILINDSVTPENLQRFMIFMTDGNNNEPAFDNTTLDACRTAIDNGVRVFTVAFEAPENGQNLLKQCASLPKKSHFFDASNAEEFRSAFARIGAEIAELNTRITQ